MAEKHVVLTGPITGSVRLPDGTVVDVTPLVVEADSVEQAAEIAHQVSLHYAEHGHPHDVELDEKTGKRVQRKFNYNDSHYKAHLAAKKKGGE